MTSLRIPLSVAGVFGLVLCMGCGAPPEPRKSAVLLSVAEVEAYQNSQEFKDRVQAQLPKIRDCFARSIESIKDGRVNESNVWLERGDEGLLLAAIEIVIKEVEAKGWQVKRTDRTHTFVVKRAQQ